MRYYNIFARKLVFEDCQFYHENCYFYLSRGFRLKFNAQKIANFGCSFLSRWRFLLGLFDLLRSVQKILDNEPFVTFSRLFTVEKRWSFSAGLFFAFFFVVQSFVFTLGWLNGNAPKKQENLNNFNLTCDCLKIIRNNNFRAKM